MIVTCDACKLDYDDEYRLTYCPHDDLGGNYCRQHDLFVCPFHKPDPGVREART